MTGEGGGNPAHEHFSLDGTISYAQRPVGNHLSILDTNRKRKWLISPSAVTRSLCHNNGTVKIAYAFGLKQLLGDPGVLGPAVDDGRECVKHVSRGVQKHHFVDVMTPSFLESDTCVSHAKQKHKPIKNHWDILRRPAARTFNRRRYNDRHSCPCLYNDQKYNDYSYRARIAVKWYNHI